MDLGSWPDTFASKCLLGFEGACDFKTFPIFSNIRWACWALQFGWPSSLWGCGARFSPLINTPPNIYFQSPAESEAKFCRLPDMATMTLWHIHGKTSCSLRAVSRSQWQPDDRPLDKQGRTYKNIIVLRLVSNQFQLASSGWLPAVLKQKFRLEDREISAEYIHTYW